MSMIFGVPPELDGLPVPVKGGKPDGTDMPPAEPVDEKR